MLTLFATSALLAGSVATPVNAEDWYADGKSAVAARADTPLNTNRARNVILFVADGMGVSTITAARIYDGQSRGESGEENSLSFETFPHVALVKTYNTDAQVSDSAGTASALNTGIKTRIGMIGTTSDQRDACFGPTDDFPLTIAEIAESKGLSTGIVSTARITHATPAAVYGHAPDRAWEADSTMPPEALARGCQDLAQQMTGFAKGDGLDVMLGGGRAMFEPDGAGGKRSDGRNLPEEWLARYPDGQFVTNASTLKAAATANSGKLLGLFSPSHMAFEADRPETEEPSIADMTEAAITLLSRNDKGYYLMVEGGRIDHAHHGSNAYRALTDARAFARAVQKAVDMVDLNETLILVTADHSHVFTIAGYPGRGNPILGFVAFQEPGEDRKLSMALDGRPYTTLGYGNGSGAVSGARKEVTEKEVMAAGYQQESAVPLGSETHGGEDVALFATGPWSHLANGVMEQNEIFHIIDHAMGLTAD